MSWVIFEIGINVFQATLIVYFLNKQLHSNRSHKFADALCVLAISIWSTLYLFVEITVSDITIFIFAFVYALIVYDDRWHLVLFWTIVIALIFLCAVNIASTFYQGILRAELDQLLNETSLRVDFVISTNLLTMFFALIITKTKRTNYQLPWQSSVLLVGLNLVCVIAVEFVFIWGITVEANELLIGLCICLFTISIMSIVLFEVLVESAYKQQTVQGRDGSAAVN